MDELKGLLKKLSETEGVSASEKNPKDIVKEELKKLAISFKEDRVGNLIAFKRGRKSNRKVMLASHIDEIGLIVTSFDENVLRFSTIGGFDERILLGLEVIVHGKGPLKGIIGSIPPHFLPKEKQKKVLSIEDLFIDVGLSGKELKKNVEVGNFVSLKKNLEELLNERHSGKSLDNRASVTALISIFEELNRVNHNWDVYGVFTVQEEITGLGALSSSYNIFPDAGIAIDVGFGKQSGFPSEHHVELDKGPTITIGPNIHPGLQNGIVKIAKDYEIPYQIEAEPGPTGTDASDIQISRSGIPTILVSIPILYMHTPCEVVSLKDIGRTTRLISLFISHLNVDMLKGDKYAT
ncbi:MAG: M42 family peptidase [Candidatus Cloacimonadota bacterium]|nr:MAG: M42 family peptidase [Candidatus Cloacimonadota bacterium]